MYCGHFKIEQGTRASCKFDRGICITMETECQKSVTRVKKNKNNNNNNKKKKIINKQSHDSDQNQCSANVINEMFKVQCSGLLLILEVSNIL